MPSPFPLTLLVAALLVAGCASVSADAPGAADREALKRDVDDEVTIGKAMAAKLLGHLGEYRKSEAALAYVALVGNVVATKVGRPELTFRFGVLDAEVPNAFATPGGYVFVTKGLLRLVHDESELAVVLGHEIAHVNERHMYRQIRPKKEVGVEETLVRLLSRGGSTLTGSLAQIVNEGMKKLLDGGLGTAAETSADEIGMQYAQSAGYAPSAFPRFLTRLSSARRETASAAYPALPDRLARASRFLSRNHITDPKGPDRSVLKRRFHEALADL